LSFECRAPSRFFLTSRNLEPNAASTHWAISSVANVMYFGLKKIELFIKNVRKRLRFLESSICHEFSEAELAF